jgi:hypothetical protein
MKKYSLAGLLACFCFCGLPIILRQWLMRENIFMKLTAAGTAQDLHLIPF